VNDPLETIVYSTLARYLRAPAGDIRPGHDLRRDLKLYPLDLVFFALRFEELLRVDVPAERLFDVRTVADLMGALRACAEAAPRAERASAELVA
jgi:acyl carrier protein